MIVVTSKIEIEFKESFIYDYAWVSLWGSFESSNGGYISTYSHKDVKLNFLDKILGTTLKEKTEKEVKIFKSKTEIKRLYLESEMNAIEGLKETI